MAETRGAFIIGEIIEGKIAGTTFELLAAGRKIAEGVGGQVCGVLLGERISEEQTSELIFGGADRVIAIEHPLLSSYQTEPYLAALEKLCREREPEVVLMAHTDMGRDLAPRLALRLNTGLITDCIDILLEEGKVLFLKPVYGGNAHAIYRCETKPQMATIRPKAVEPLQRDETRKGEIERIAPQLDPASVKVKVIERVKEEAPGVKLEEAEVVVCGGRGIGGPEGFKELEELAKLLGGAVGATRPPCDQGWVPPHLQIGLTGKIVSPNLYIGIALSGSSQHLAGITGAKNIIAINKDEEANIFKVARFGVVGDYKKVLPAFIAKCRELLSK